LLLARQNLNEASDWKHKLVISDDDVAFLYDWLHAQGKPRTAKDLALALIEQRLAVQAKAIQAELSKGEAYQPKKSYTVGQTLVFPALEFAAGTVLDIRDGVNPMYPAFKVIKVQIAGRSKPREFPAELDYPHRLNTDVLGILEGSSAKDIYQEHKAVLEPALTAKFSEGSDLGFVQLDGHWFLRELMAEVHVGHLNLAEALVELNNRPVSSPEILKELDLPVEIGADVRRFSLEAALLSDERFINLGTPKEPLWYLRRLIPADVLSKPVRLTYTPIVFDRSAVQPVLHQIEDEIDDEASELATRAPDKRKPGDKVTVVLSPPHRRTGTLPLTPRTAGFFPESGASMIPVRLVDGQKGGIINGWVVPGGRYVFGLGGWYAKNELPAGTLITVQRTANASEVIVDFAPRRLRREWVRVARVDDGQLTFQMTKYPIACEYDEAMLMAEDGADDLDALWLAEEQQRRPVLDVLLDIFPELAKLSPRVHAKTVYAGFNMIRRCPPGPIFYELSVNPCFEDAGNGYWTFDPGKLHKR
jgi:DNA-directed RNA polymerase delta subunit